jgi:hypothetical protein
VLLAAITPTAPSLVLAILTVFWFFFGQVLLDLLSRFVDPVHLLTGVALPAFSPRPPPEL